MDRGAELYLKVRAGANQNMFVGSVSINNKIYYKLYITQVPENGKANKHIIKFIASYFNISQQDISISSGQKSSFKTIFVKNICPNYLNSKLKHYI